MLLLLLVLLLFLLLNESFVLKSSAVMSKRQTKLDEKKGKSAEPPKKTLKVEASADESGACMDKGAVSKMINFLKYRADDKKNKRGEGLLDAKAALETYTSLPKSEKADFLAAFEKHGNKNLGWVQSFKKTDVLTSSESKEILQNWCNRTIVLLVPVML